MHQLSQDSIRYDSSVRAVSDSWLPYQTTEFSLSSLYDRTLKTACPVASSSEVQLVIPTHSVNAFTIEPEAAKKVQKLAGRDVAVWETKEGVFFPGTS